MPLPAVLAVRRDRSTLPFHRGHRMRREMVQRSKRHIIEGCPGTMARSVPSPSVSAGQKCPGTCADSQHSAAMIRSRPNPHSTYSAALRAIFAKRQSDSGTSLQKWYRRKATKVASGREPLVEGVVQCKRPRFRRARGRSRTTACGRLEAVPGQLSRHICTRLRGYLGPTRRESDLSENAVRITRAYLITVAAAAMVLSAGALV